MKRKKGKGKVVRLPKNQQPVKPAAASAAPPVPVVKPLVDIEKYRNQVWSVTVLPAGLESIALRALPPEVIAVLKPRMTHAECEHTEGIPILKIFYRLEERNVEQAQPAAQSIGPKSTQQ